ncbi:MAG: hypothetical protein KIT14_09920 [bacterium]|nr:hypothetical protein [bacterium]
MVVVALQHPRADPDALAEALGVSVWDAQQRLRGDGPRIVARVAARDEADRLAVTLAAHGFAPLVLDIDPAGPGELWVVPRTFQLRDEALHLTTRDGSPFAIRWERIGLLLRGTRIVSDTVTEEHRRRRFDPVRAVMTGGLMMTRTTTTTTTRATEERIGFLHIVAHGVSDVVVYEDELLYDGLGPQLEPTRAGNFAAFVALVRAAAPHALYDEQLLTRAGQMAVLGGVLDPETYVDVATVVLIAALAPAEITHGAERLV